MKATDQLKEEHEAIKVMLKILEKVAQKLESGEKVNTEHLEKIVDFIRLFADKCHHGKEENVLFPTMEKAGIPKEGGPIGVMLTEHGKGRDYIKEISDGITEYKEGDHKASSKIIENASKYVSLLTQHIDKEDNILYPMGDSRLSAEKQEELLDQFEKIEEERIGVGKHEELHKLLHQLKKIYLES